MRAPADKAFHRQGSYKRLKAKFSRLDDLNRRCVAQAQKHGFVETIPDGTVNPRRGYPLFCRRGDDGLVLPTTPLNYRTQGTAGWWMVKAINRCGARLFEWRAKGFDAWMILTVHDELVFDFPSRPKDDLMQRRRIEELRRLMEQGGNDIGVPTPVSVKRHAISWGEGKVA